MKRLLLLALLVLSGCASSPLLVYQNGSWESAENQNTASVREIKARVPKTEATNTIPTSTETTAPRSSKPLPTIGPPTHFL